MKHSSGQLLFYISEESGENEGRRVSGRKTMAIGQAMSVNTVGQKKRYENGLDKQKGPRVL